MQCPVEIRVSQTSSNYMLHVSHLSGFACSWVLLKKHIFLTREFSMEEISRVCPLVWDFWIGMWEEVPEVLYHVHNPTQSYLLSKIQNQIGLLEKIIYLM